MSSNRSTFQKGSGCFKCEICHKLTRDTGENAEGMCTKCTRMWENGNAEANGESLPYPELGVI